MGKIKNPEGKVVKLPPPYEVFFVGRVHWGEIIIQTREHIKDTSSSVGFLCDETKKPKWAKELLRYNEIYHISVNHHTIKIDVIENCLFSDVWNKIKGCLEKEVLNDLEC